MNEIYFQGKQIIIKVHAVKRAREREIAFPDQVYDVLQTGKVKRFGKHGGSVEKVNFACFNDVPAAFNFISPL